MVSTNPAINEIYLIDGPVQLIDMNSYSQELDMFISHPPKKVLDVWGPKSVGKSHLIIEKCRNWEKEV